MKNILFLSREINRRCAIKLNAVYTAAKARGWTVHEAEFGWTALDIADIVASLNWRRRMLTSSTSSRSSGLR